MELSSHEHEVLRVAHLTPPDCGAHVSVESLEKAAPQLEPAEVERALRSLSGKKLVSFDEHGCVTVSESGIAALEFV